MKGKGIDLRPLKPWLQKGEIEAVAKEVGVTKTHASQYMRGRWPNYEFAQKINERVQRNKALKEQIESL